jgi:hypothetical protein
MGDHEMTTKDETASDETEESIARAEQLIAGCNENPSSSELGELLRVACRIRWLEDEVERLQRLEFVEDEAVLSAVLKIKCLVDGNWAAKMLVPGGRASGFGRTRAAAIAAALEATKDLRGAMDLVIARKVSP